MYFWSIAHWSAALRQWAKHRIFSKSPNLFSATSEKSIFCSDNTDLYSDTALAQVGSSLEIRH